MKDISPTELLIVIVGAVLVTVILVFTIHTIVRINTIDEKQIYEPEYTHRSATLTCYGWDVNPDMIGVSPKFWMCDNGVRIFDDTGVKSPTAEDFHDEN